MASINHTYDESCILHTDSNMFTRRASQISLGPPPLKAHFFYCSSLPIDDPLLPIPPPSTSSAKSTRIPPRPFSVYDNRALEEAWLRIHKPFKSIEASPRKSLDDFPKKDIYPKESDGKIHESISKIFKGAQERGSGPHSMTEGEIDPKASTPSLSTTAGSPTQGLHLASSRRTSTSSATPRQSRFQEQTDTQVALPQEADRTPLAQVAPVTAEEIGASEEQANVRPTRKRSRSPFKRKERRESTAGVINTASTDTNLPKQSSKQESLPDTLAQQTEQNEFGSSPTERNTTGTPFLRISSRRSRSRARSRPSLPAIEVERPNTIEHSDRDVDGGTDSSPRATLQRLPRSNHLRRDLQASDYANSKKVQEARVPVGVSRLHVVELPVLKVRSRWLPSQSLASYKHV